MVSSPSPETSATNRVSDHSLAGFGVKSLGSEMVQTRDYAHIRRLPSREFLPPRSFLHLILVLSGSFI